MVSTKITVLFQTESHLGRLSTSLYALAFLWLAGLYPVLTKIRAQDNY